MMNGGSSNTTGNSNCQGGGSSSNNVYDYDYSSSSTTTTYLNATNQQQQQHPVSQRQQQQQQQQHAAANAIINHQLRQQMNHRVRMAQQQQQQQQQLHRTTTPNNAYLQQVAATSQQQQQHHGPSTLQYDPTVNHRAPSTTQPQQSHPNYTTNHQDRLNSSCNNNNSNVSSNNNNCRNQQELYLALLNASGAAAGTAASVAAAACTTATSTNRQQNQQQQQQQQQHPVTTTHTIFDDTIHHHRQHPQQPQSLSPLPFLGNTTDIRSITAATAYQNHHYHPHLRNITATTNATTATTNTIDPLDELLFGDDSDDALLLLQEPLATTAQQQQFSLLLQKQAHAQQQQQQAAASSLSSSTAAYLSMQASTLFQIPNVTDARMMSSSSSISQMNTNNTVTNSCTSNMQSTIILLHKKILHEPWMDEVRLTISSLSLTPITGYDILLRIQSKLQDVVHKYVPCVDFLVFCQQDLRRGLDLISAQASTVPGSNRAGRLTNAEQTKRYRARVQHINQFYTSYLQTKIPYFHKEYHPRIVDRTAMTEAKQGLVTLQTDASRVLQEQLIMTTPSASSSLALTVQVRNGCEAIKSTFLGGMKDGESWGLRKWLSKHGKALHVCTDLECILNACQTLSRDATSTKQLAYQLRIMSKPVLLYLQSEIPPSYQKHSSAHPYLPFFHRLESALRSLSNFDPDDDDVICLDDDDDDENDADVVVEIDPTNNHCKLSGMSVDNDKNCKKRAAVDNSSSDSDSVGDYDDEYDRTRTVQNNETKRTYIHIVDTPPKTNGYHDRAGHNDNKNLNNDRDNHSSSGESDVESVVEIIDIIEHSNMEPISFAVIGNSTTNNHTSNSNDWTCTTCTTINLSQDTSCSVCGEEALSKELLNFSQEFFNHRPYDAVADNQPHTDDANEYDPTSNENMNHMLPTDGMMNSNSSTESSVASHQTPLWPVPINQPEIRQAAALVIANNLELMANIFDQNLQSSIRAKRIPEGSFWDGTHYGSALRLFAQIIRAPESYHYLECVDDDQLFQAGNSPLFSHVIKHPLSLRQIARSLLGDEMQQWSSNNNREDGYLTVRGLSKWNMWIGKELLQAIDLVFLNSLAYGNALNQGRSSHRSSTNQLRKIFWNGISSILGGIDVECRKQSMPTRRAEKSGFVVYKIGES
jgi:hypothetical protein